jgi:hypothetical protein
MNARSLRVLIGLTVVVIVLAVLFQSNREGKVQPKSEQSKLFPELMASINEVSTVHVKRSGSECTLKRTGESWGLAEKDSYPADVEPMRKALIAVADMTRVEAKTSDAARYAALGVQDPDAEGSTSTLLTLADASGKELAKLIVGKPHQGKTGMPGQLYVRRVDDPQSWLVKSDLTVPEGCSDWLVKKILEVKRDRIRVVEVTHPDGEIVRVERATPETTEYALANMPVGRELKYATVASAMSSTLEWLNLEDVARIDTVDFATNPGATSRFWTFDGLVITVTLKDEGEKTYAKFVAAYEAPPASDTPAVEPTPEGEAKPDGEKTEAERVAAEKAETDKTAPKKKPEEVQAEVAELNARLSHWAYVIPSYNKTTFAKHMTDLLKEETPPAPPVDDSTLGVEDKDSYVIPGDLPPEIQQQIREHQESLGNKTKIGPARKTPETPPEGTPPEDKPADEKPPEAEPPH